MQFYKIENNEFLSHGPVKAYYHERYSYEMGKADNYSKYVHVLKNTFNEKPDSELKNATTILYDILYEDLEHIVSFNKLGDDAVIVGVPRAQVESSYKSTQLLFRSTISKVANRLGYNNGNCAIKRVKDTRTTHIKKEISINGKNNWDLDMPYPGIAEKTCSFDETLLHDKNIVLIDDVYTKTTNIDEDIIEALYNHGAKRVIFYSCWYTI